jgi:hypothetical protein
MPDRLPTTHGSMVRQPGQGYRTLPARRPAGWRSWTPSWSERGRLSALALLLARSRGSVQDVAQVLLDVRQDLVNRDVWPQLLARAR